VAGGLLLAAAVAAPPAGAGPGLQAAPPAPSASAANAPRLVAQLGHEQMVRSAQVSPDGRRVLTAGWNGTVITWDAESGLQLRVIAAHNMGIASASFSPDGRWIATGSDDGTAKLWDAETGGELHTLAGHSAPISSVAFAPDARRIVTTSYDATARIWDAATGQELLVLSGHAGTVTAAAFTPDGSVITTGADRTARLWDGETGKQVRAFTGHTNGVWSLALSPRGDRLLTGSLDRSAAIWDVETGRCLRTLVGHSLEVTTTAWAPDGRRVLTGGNDGTARLWDADTGRFLRSFSSVPSQLSSVAFSPDGRTILTASYEAPTKLWDVETGRELRSFAGLSSGAVRDVWFSPDARRLVIGLASGMRIWDVSAGHMIRSVAVPTYLDQMAVSPGGQRVLTTGFHDEVARLWDPSSGRQLWGLATRGRVWRAAFSPDGRRIVVQTGGEDPSVRIWDAGTGRELRVLARPSSITAVAFTPDGHRFLAGGAIWDAATLRVVRALPPKLAEQDAVFSADGRTLLATQGDAAKLWDVDAGRELRSFVRAGVRDCWRVSFSPDEKRVVTGEGFGRTSTVWDAQTGRELVVLHGHSGFVESVGFSPDSRFVLTGSADGTSILWDAFTGGVLSRLVSFEDGTWAVVDPEGRYDASGAGDIEGLHWVIGNTPIALSQLKRRYYDPGLLAKVTGFDPRPLREVTAFTAPRLFPRVEVTPPAPGSSTVRIKLRDQGGGIGKVQVRVNGKEIVADARGPSPAATGGERELVVDLAGAPVKPGEENTLEAVSWNDEGYLSSRGARATWREPPANDAAPPAVYIIACGTTHYASSSLDLRFPGKDAADMAHALEIGAARLLGAENVHVRLLSDQPGAADAAEPTRENLADAFQGLRAAKPTDVVIVYLSGHGTTSPDGEYWYLTREATSGDLSDPEVRSRSGISSATLTEWMKAIPSTKQVMILDTCAAGAAAKSLAAQRAPTEQLLAIEELKDRTGVHVLMGSAANAVSYEASRYGQGILTYALLQGMRGAALRSGEYVDVSTLFGYAVEEVPRLAGALGENQKPNVAAPRGTSFVVGRLTSEDKARIPVAAARPLLLRASLQDVAPPFADDLGLSLRVNAALREASTSRGSAEVPVAFVDADEYPGALRVTGRYRIAKGSVRIEAYLLDGVSRRGRLEITGPASDPEALARTLVARAVRLIQGR
jgi:WD40 repeat protein